MTDHKGWTTGQLGRNKHLTAHCNMHSDNVHKRELTISGARDMNTYDTHGDWTQATVIISMRISMLL